MNFISPPCPKCGTSVPLKQTQWGLGTPFTCRGCKSKLVISKNYWIGLVAFVAFWFSRELVDGFWEMALLIAALVVIVLALSRIFLLPQTVVD